MKSYSERILSTLQEFAYLIYCCHIRGTVAVSHSEEKLFTFEPSVRPIVKFGLELLTMGLERKQLRMFLELKKLERIKDSAMTAEDLKLIH